MNLDSASALQLQSNIVLLLKASKRNKVSAER